METVIVQAVIFVIGVWIVGGENLFAIIKAQLIGVQNIKNGCRKRDYHQYGNKLSHNEVILQKKSFFSIFFMKIFALSLVGEMGLLILTLRKCVLYTVCIMRLLCRFFCLKNYCYEKT